MIFVVFGTVFIPAYFNNNMNAMIIGILCFIAVIIVVSLYFTKLRKKLHRKLFHNIFVLIIAAGLVFYYSDYITATIATFNLLLHLIMDLNNNGIMLFYPFSDHRMKA